MNKKYLLREYHELCEGGVCQDFLTEDEKRRVQDGAVILTGKLQEAEAENGNGRRYPVTILKREIELYTKLVMERRALGELDHPEDSVINLKNASHLVTKVWWDGNTVMGKIEVLPTPSGQTLKSLVQSGVTLGISSRGLGSVDEGNGNTVNEDFQLICFDIVSEPSTSGAFLVAESKTPNIFTKSDRMNRALNDLLES